MSEEKPIAQKVTSGKINGLTHDTALHDVRKSRWLRTSVHVDVYDTSLRRQIAGVNRHLIDDYAEDTDTSA